MIFDVLPFFFLLDSLICLLEAIEAMSFFFCLRSKMASRDNKGDGRGGIIRHDGRVWPSTKGENALWVGGKMDSMTCAAHERNHCMLFLLLRGARGALYVGDFVIISHLC